MDKEELLKKIQLAKQDNILILDLAGNNIKELPPDIGQLINLNELYLDDNQLTVIPPEVGKLTKLTGFSITGNQITHLPVEICQLRKLMTLSLNINQIASLPGEIGQLTKLERISITDNRLTTLPSEIGQLKKLTRLYFDDNQLTTLPPEIGQLSKLTTLSLSDNRLTTFPPEIGQLKNLTTLAISNNQLTTLPPEIGQLKNLMRLYITGNQLTTLPPEVVQLTKLRKLDLTGNPVDDGLEKIIKSIEFSPEHYQAGMMILSYFGQIVRQKYPDIPVKVKIEQDGKIVTMIIETPEGYEEKIEKTLWKYGLVVQGKLTPDELLSNPLHVLELQNRLDLTRAELKMQKNLLEYTARSQRDMIYSLKDQVKILHNKIGEILSDKNTKISINVVNEGVNVDSRKNKVIDSPGSIIKIPDSHNEREILSQNISKLLESLESYKADKIKKNEIIRSLENVKEELIEEDNPDESRIKEWLKKAKKGLKCLKLGKDIIDTINGIYTSFDQVF